MFLWYIGRHQVRLGRAASQEVAEAEGSVSYTADFVSEAEERALLSALDSAQHR